jgi:hypothetical protein
MQAFLLLLAVGVLSSPVEGLEAAGNVWAELSIKIELPTMKVNFAVAVRACVC